jgi:ABC-type Fe3+ transport system substrate-binding protein
VTGDEGWYGGFEFGFLDNAKQNSFGIGWEKQLLGYVNYDLVSESELRTPQDLLNPKWRGKVAFARNSGGTHLFAMVIRNKLGDDAVKQFFIDQEAVLTTDTRVLTEDLARGKYAIAGADSVRLRQLQAEGIGKNVKRLDIPDFTMIRETGVHLFDKAPHPNAAKVFINWLLTKEGQSIWSKAGQYNSRRRDVPTFWDDLALKDGDEKLYVRANTEETLPKVVAAQELYERIIK